MKNTKRNTIFVLLIAIIVIYFIVKDDFQSIVNNLILANKWLIILSVVLIFLYWLFRAMSLYLIAREYKKKIKFRVILQQTLITQFFNGITPFATGGEPMQVYMLTKSGIKVANATNIIVQEFIMYQIALVVIGFVALFLNFRYNICTLSPILGNLILIGFIINISIGLVLLFVSFSKRFSRAIVNLALKLCIKLRIVKNVEKAKKSWNEKVEEYNESGTMLKENKALFCECVLLNIFSLALFYLIPYFVFLSLGYHNIGLMQVFVSSAFILIVGNFVPMPGGTGGIEFAFSKFFELMIPSVALKSALLIWRVITYYLGIIVGGISLGFFKGDDKS